MWVCLLNRDINSWYLDIHYTLSVKKRQHPSSARSICKRRWSSWQVPRRTGIRIQRQHCFKQRRQQTRRVYTDKKKCKKRHKKNQDKGDKKRKLEDERERSAKITPSSSSLVLRLACSFFSPVFISLSSLLFFISCNIRIWDPEPRTCTQDQVNDLRKEEEEEGTWKRHPRKDYDDDDEGEEEREQEQDKKNRPWDSRKRCKKSVNPLPEKTSRESVFIFQ